MGRKVEPESNGGFFQLEMKLEAVETDNEVDYFSRAWKMYQEGGHKLILKILKAHPNSISEESVVIANMAQSMEDGVLYQHKGIWKYREV